MRDGPPGAPSYFSSPLRSFSPMRSRSPMPGTGGGISTTGEFSSTSSLLQEISSLRSRLRDLEDDTKSSVVTAGLDDKDNPMFGMMKKDIAKLEQEKALQEKDFLNQMSSLQAEHQRHLDELTDKVKKKDELNHIINDKLRKYVAERDELNVKLAGSCEKVNESMVEIDELKEKLRLSVKEGEMSRSKSETEEKYMYLLEDARESHVKEIEQMKANLAASDVEIAESRGEVDHLQMEIDEMQSYREALLDEVTKIRLDLSEEKRTSQSLEAELKDTKFKVERLHLEVKEKDVRYNKKCDEVLQLKKTPLSGSQGMKRLQSEIREKDETIAQQNSKILELEGAAEDLETHKTALAAVVADFKRQMEEGSSKPLSINTAPSTDDDDSEKPITPAEKDQLVKDMRGLEARLVRFHSKLADKECQIDELTLSLKEERTVNKQMRAELKKLNAEMHNSSAALRLERQRPGSQGAVDVSLSSELASLRRQNKTLNDELEKLRATRSSNVHIQPSKVIATASSSTSVASRSVASTKKNDGAQRLFVPPTLKRTTSVAGSCDGPRTPVSGLVASFERRLGSKSHVPPSRQLVQEEVSPLPSPIQANETNDELQSDYQLVLELQEQLNADRKTITKLQDQLKAIKERGTEDTERQLTKLSATEQSQSAELKKLRSDVLRHEAKKADLEATINDKSDEISQLHFELQRVKERAFHQEEKKMETDEDEIEALHAELEKKENYMAHLQAEYDEYKEDTREHLDRLNGQVEALESELEFALTKIEELQLDVDHRNVLKREDQDHARETMELELTMAKASHDDLLNELNEKIADLESAIEQHKEHNREIATQVPAEAQQVFEEEKQTLAAELSSCRVTIADLETEHSIQRKNLEDRIKAQDVELEDEKREKESLRQFVATSEAAAVGKTDTEKKLNGEISRLSFALTKVQMAKANLERENMEKLKILENEVETLEVEANAELDKKCDEIDALKLTLLSKEEEIQRLEHERTQLCTSMNDVSFSRKDEMDEMQAELLDMTMQTKSQAREIQTLKLTIEEYESRKEDASSKLQRRIRELESNIAEMKESSAGRDDLALLKEENAVLRETIRDVKIERRQLKERLDCITQEKSTSRSSQILRDRNNVLKEEVEKLTKRLKKMEASITRFAI